MITIHVTGLRLHGRHGVFPEERERGQEFVFDVELDVGERGTSDRHEEAVDYVEVARAVREVSDAHAYNLLEALAAAIADELERRFSPDGVRIRIAKPEVSPDGLDATVGVTLSRP